MNPFGRTQRRAVHPTLQMRASPPVLGALTFLLAAGNPAAAAAQPPSTPDFSGTWILDPGRSDFAGAVVPKSATSTMTRTGSQYRVEQVGDFGPSAGGLQHLTYNWPAGSGEVTNDLPQDGSMHVTTQMRGDTSIFAVDISKQGRVVLRQSGRAFLSDGGRTMTREVDSLPMEGPEANPVHVVLVYGRKM